MTDEQIIAYLLEELPENEQEQFEDFCFAQETWPPEVNLVEGDLIDAYLRDELPPERRQRFERNYLITEARRERVIMAAALLRHVDEYEARSQRVADDAPRELTWYERLRALWNKQTPMLKAATAFALVAIVASVVWLSLFRTPSPKTFATLALTVSASNNRAQGVDAPKVQLPLKADALKISLALPRAATPVSRYRVVLESQSGETKPLEVVEQNAQAVSAVIPAAQLKRGLYAVDLIAVKADGTEQAINGSYYFSVE